MRIGDPPKDAATEVGRLYTRVDRVTPPVGTDLCPGWDIIMNTRNGSGRNEMFAIIPPRNVGA